MSPDEAIGNNGKRGVGHQGDGVWDLCAIFTLPIMLIASDLTQCLTSGSRGAGHAFTLNNQDEDENFWERDGETEGRLI